jgi:hypothetical protein
MLHRKKIKRSRTGDEEPVVGGMFSIDRLTFDVANILRCVALLWRCWLK